MRVSTDELRAIVAAREGKCTEFKRGLQRDATLARTLAAFANTRGGLLLVGVGDRGEILGAPRPRETARHLAAIAREHVDPPVEVEIALVQLESKTIVCCSVPLSPARPHAALDDAGRGTVLVRSGSSNRAAKPADLARIAPDGERELSDLERRALAWIGSARGGEPATAPAFARAAGAGIQRCRRALLDLERAGLLIGHGSGDRRAYRRP